MLGVNLLTGNIPAEFGKLPNLGDLALFQNNLQGQIPVSLGNLSHLVSLSLAQNQLQGRIPASLGNCSNLQKLLLNNNALSGSIPRQLFNLKKLFNLDLSTNLLSGNLPSEVGQLQNLNLMNFSSNSLTGSIPTSLGRCRSLVFLNLSHNSFASNIPMSLAALSVLDEVDLSSNNLTGVIPTYFTNFNQLRILNLSFNDLAGEVPTEGPFKNASRVSVLGNKKLCGGVVELHLPSCSKTNDTRGHKGRLLLLKTILPLAIGTSTLLFVCCVLAYYRRKLSRNDPTPFISVNQQHMQVTYAELHRATNGFSAANLIGSGSFGSVFKGTLVDSYQMDVAIKVINNVEHASLQSFTAECDALKKVRHRNVVKILTSCSSLDFQGNEFKALVFKFMPNASLDSWVHPNFGQDLYLSFGRRLDIAMDVANALDYLHNHCETPIVHCDLKPNNILIDEEMVAHVTDFGLAKVLLDVGDDSSCTSMLKGSIGYIPPEYGASYKVTPHGDVYSYGVLLLELFIGKRPTDEMFTDGINISKYAGRHLHGRLMEIVDQTLLLHENIEQNTEFQDCLSCVIEIGISCTSELPQKRKNMSLVCMELQAAIEKYIKKIRR